MAELEDGFGDGVFGEGIEALLFEMLEPGGGERVIGHGKGEAGDDHVRESLAGHVHSGPEAVGAEEHAVHVLFELLEHLMPRHSPALHEEPIAAIIAMLLQLIGHLRHERVAGEEHEGASA